jgi:hypothetical protein
MYVRVYVCMYVDKWLEKIRALEASLSMCVCLCIYIYIYRV